MSGQQPLTACPSPALDWSRPEAPASTDFDDIYFSVDNGLEESRAVFLGGCGLPEGWQNRSKFVIGELGFGTGLNFLAAWQMWQDTKPDNGHLHFISIEKYPLSRDNLARALATWPDLSEYAERLVDLWPGPVKGFHRLHIAPDVTLTLCFMDVTSGLAAIKAEVDAWFLDGFSPAKNPDMWPPEIIQSVANLSASGARLATFTVAGFVREGLAEAGFSPTKKPGFGRKRHRLEAVFQGSVDSDTSPSIRPIIIGGGIAGASLAKAFARRGICPVIIENDQVAASGNAAAIVKPRLDLQDRPESRFFLASYLYAVKAYSETDAVLSRGVTQYTQSDAEKKRYEKLTKHAPLPAEHLANSDGVIDFDQALVIDPKAVLSEWKHAGKILKGTAHRIEKIGDDCQVYDANGKSLASGTHVIIAAGYGVKDLIDISAFGIRYTRGQLTWAQSHPDITTPISYGGYAIPLKQGLLLGATNGHITDEKKQNAFAILAEDDAENLDALENAMGIRVEHAETPSRAAVRVVTNDTLPKFDEIESGKWVLTGLGSRGFVFAPLLGEAIVSEICEDPSPLDKNIGARFGAREKSNLKTRPS